MLPSRASSATLTVLTDHESAEGPVVTHVRTLLLLNTLTRLRQLGLYEAYEREMPRRHLETIQQTLASSWLPVEHAIAHYEVCDRLPITRQQLEELGSHQARRIKETFLGIALQRARSLGVDGLKLSFGQVGRLHERIYLGGGCTALEVGPKDLQFEIHGFPFADSRTFQVAWRAYCTTMAELFAKVVYAKMTRPREPHPFRLAISVSWV